MNIADYVPHRGRMSWLDRLVSADADGAEAEVTPRADALFADADGVPAWIGLEYMAQTVAAWSGARARAAGGEPRIGYLLGSRRYHCTRSRLPLDAPLRVRVHCELLAANGLGQFDCRLLDAQGQELAQALISVYEPLQEATP